MPPRRGRAFPVYQPGVRNPRDRLCSNFPTPGARASAPRTDAAITFPSCAHTASVEHLGAGRRPLEPRTRCKSRWPAIVSVTTPRSPKVLSDDPERRSRWECWTSTAGVPGAPRSPAVVTTHGTRRDERCRHTRSVRAHRLQCCLRESSNRTTPDSRLHGSSCCWPERELCFQPTK